MIPGGRQGTGNVDYIFEWDGQSSTNNTSNINLFQSIYEKQKEKDCIVIGRLSSSYNGPVVFIIRKNSIALNTTTSFKTNSGDILTAAQGNYGYTYGYVFVYTLAITLNNNGIVTNINQISSSSSGIKYLDPNTNYTKTYTPQYSGSPATKQYVDDSVSNIMDNVFVINNTDIAYENNTTLWNNLYTKQKTKECYLITTDSTKQIAIVFFIPVNGLTNSTSTSKQFSIYSSPYKIDVVNVSNSYSRDALYKCLLVITVVNDSITNVGNLLNSMAYGGNYLSPTGTYSTPFIPTNSGQPTSKKYVDDLIVIGTEEDASENTQIIFDEDELDYVTEVVNSLNGNETTKSPSVLAVNQKLAELTTGMETYTTLYNDSTNIGSAGTITLTDNPLKYNTIKIMGYINCTDDSTFNNSFCCELYITNKANSTSYICSINTSTYNDNSYNYSCNEILTFNSNKTITRGTQKIYRSDSALFNANINIVTVLGYKRSF